MGKLDGKVALVTGAARGQGAAEAALFADEGATVFITDVLVDAGREDRRRTSAARSSSTTSPTRRSGTPLVEQVVADHGRLDVLVNNAGILRWEHMTETIVRRLERGRRGQPDRRVPRHEGASRRR